MARAKETLPVASFPVSGNSPKYEEKIFLFTLPLKFISIFFKIYTCNVKIFHLCIYIYKYGFKCSKIKQPSKSRLINQHR